MALLVSLPVSLPFTLGSQSVLILDLNVTIDAPVILDAVRAGEPALGWSVTAPQLNWSVGEPTLNT